MDIYKLYRKFWNFAFENPEKIKPNHVAVYSFSIEHCNRLGWKKKFGFPASMVLEATGIKSYSVYKKTFDELVEFGFIKVLQYSKNQYSSNIIALEENYKAPDKAPHKALDKALITHMVKQEERKCSIDKPIYKYTNIPVYQDTNIHAEKVSASYKTCLDIYFEWHEKKTGVKPQFDGSDGKALKAIIKHLETLEPGEENIKKNFEAVFSGFDLWEKFHQGQLRIRQINSNLTNIINTLKNGKSNSKATGASVIAEMEKRNYQ